MLVSHILGQPVKNWPQRLPEMIKNSQSQIIDAVVLSIPAGISPGQAEFRNRYYVAGE